MANLFAFCTNDSQASVRVQREFNSSSSPLSTGLTTGWASPLPRSAGGGGSFHEITKLFFLFVSLSRLISSFFLLFPCHNWSKCLFSVPLQRENPVCADRLPWLVQSSFHLFSLYLSIFSPGQRKTVSPSSSFLCLQGGAPVIGRSRQ